MHQRLHSLQLDELEEPAWATQGLVDRSGVSLCWLCWFHHDEKVWVRLPRVFVDHGRGMPNGEPVLLKRRECLRRDADHQCWKDLVHPGWSAIEHSLGPDAGP